MPSTSLDPRVGTTTDAPPKQLHTFHRNPRRGDISAIAASLKTHGQYKPITVNIGTHTGRPNEVLAGNHTLMAFRNLAETDPDTFSTIKVHWVDVDDDTADRIVVVDNRTSELGTMDTELLYEIISGLPDLSGTGFSAEDLESLAHAISVDGDALDQAMDDALNIEPQKRTIPLDMAFSYTNMGIAHAAFAIGWGPGVISTRTDAYRAYAKRIPNNARPVLFMDNEWHGYDHQQHLASVKEFTPKYATTRDIMTRQQCDESGVEFYTFDEIMDFAKDVAEYTENIIIIPKHDILAKIPDTIGNARVVLGYSVPSSYGRTDIHPEMFKGRPIHLLGGPWKRQRALLALLGDSVVSLDNNNVSRVAEFGQVCNRDGSMTRLSDLSCMGGGTFRNWTASLLLSLTVIMNEVVETFGVEPSIPEKVPGEDFDIEFTDH